MIQTVFFGGSRYVIPILTVLNPSLVVTTEKYVTDPVIEYCTRNTIPVLSVSSLKDSDIAKKLKAHITEVAVLANFGLMVPERILGLYPKGIINIHPSLLPKYRGPTPGISALLQGDYETGVTLIKLDTKVDHGPIIARKPLTLTDSDTGESSYLKLFTEGANLLAGILDKYVKNEIAPIEQDHDKATYTEKLTRQSGCFDINTPPGKELVKRMIYAYYPWPGVWTLMDINGRKKIVKFLPGDKIQVEGKKPMTVKDFYNGYPKLKTKIRDILGD